MKFFVESFQTILIINFIDFKDINYFDELSIRILEKNNNFFKKIIINKKIFQTPLLVNENKRIVEIEISIINSITKACKIFKIKIYKNLLNKVNIYLNNNNSNYKYCNSDIIFYGEINRIRIKNLKLNTFNLKRRLQCVILNIELNKLLEIISDNNIYNKHLNQKIKNALNNNAFSNLLINIFIGNNKSNVSMFIEEKEQLIFAKEEEKKIISQLYNDINKNINDENNINNLCESFRSHIASKKNLFGFDIININDFSLFNIISCFINQGVNCLLNNNIINERDADFMFGCLILLLYCNEKKFAINILEVQFLENIIKDIKKNGFGSLEQIKAAISFVVFYIADPLFYSLKYSKKLDDNNPYKRGFNFYKSIIEDLTEESELMLIFLQLNSGSGKEILNNKLCYKISMASISEIKEHLINNIPNYFFVFNKKNGENIALSDTSTQILSFNEQKIFEQNYTNLTILGNNDNDNKIINENKKNKIINDNKAMNVSIGMFHEGGHQKFHMDSNTGYKIEPVLFIDKNYNFQNQENLNVKKNNNKKDNISGESGMCVDFYLYNFFLYPAQIIVGSSQSYKLMNKNLFTNKLDKLNEISLKIILDFLKNNDIFLNHSTGKNDINALNNVIKTLRKETENNEDNNYIIKDGIKFYCGLGINK